MSEGRKTRRFKETNDKAELDRQWKKISAVGAWCCAVIGSDHELPPHLPSLSLSQLLSPCPGVCVCSRAGSLEAGFAPCKSVGQIFGAPGLQRHLELHLDLLPWEQSQLGAFCSGLYSR